MRETTFNLCQDLTAHNLREPLNSQIFVKAKSDICCDIEIYGSHWVPLGGTARCGIERLVQENTSPHN